MFLNVFSGVCKFLFQLTVKVISNDIGSVEGFINSKSFRALAFLMMVPMAKMGRGGIRGNRIWGLPG